MTTATATQTGTKQQLLFLYLSHAHPTSRTVGWSLYDGAGDGTTQSGDSDTPPYASVLEAMRDGWRVLQVAPPLPAQPGNEHRTAHLPYEYILERLVGSPS